MTVNKNGYGVIVSTTVPATSVASTIATLVTSFSLPLGGVGSIGATGSTYFTNTNNLCGFTNPKRTGDYSGADINTDGTAFVVAMNANADVCPTFPTNWQSAVVRVTLQ